MSTKLHYTKDCLISKLKNWLVLWGLFFLSFNLNGQNICCERAVSVTSSCTDSNNYILQITRGGTLINITGNATWNECEDGTAFFKFISDTSNGDQIYLTAYFSDKISTAPAGSPINNECGVTDNSNWMYYTSVEYKFASINYGPYLVSNLGTPLQIGVGANINSPSFGAFGAFSLSRIDDSGTTLYEGDGNLNIVLNDSCIPSVTNNPPISSCAAELVHYDMDACSSPFKEWAEFTPTIVNPNGCLEISASDSITSFLNHSCLRTHDGLGFCTPYNGGDQWQTIPDIRFQVTIDPGSSIGEISSFCFDHAAPLVWDGLGISEYLRFNLYPRKLGVVISKYSNFSNPVYQEIDIPTSRVFKTICVDLTNDTDFQNITTPTTYYIGIDAYYPEPFTGAAFRVWELDNFRIYGGCCVPECTPPTPVFDNFTACPSEQIVGDLTLNDTVGINSIYTLDTPPNRGGTVTVNSDGTFTYINDSGYSGLEWFTYQVCEDGSTEGVCCETANAFVRVDNENCAEICGIGWRDINNNGLQGDLGDVEIEGITVYLYNSLDSIEAITQTGADGSYHFYNVIPGDYYLYFDESTNILELTFVSGTFQNVMTDSLIDNGDSDIDTLYRQTEVFTVVGGEQYCNIDGGFTTTRVPVELTYFRGKGNRCTAMLEWETASELDNDYFLIEHSFDGRQFESIGIVKGHGTTSEVQQYRFEHNNLRQNLNHYRLKQVDFDGTFEYSEIEIVNTNCYENNREITEIYPNPTNENVKIKFYAENAENVEVIITDIVGKQMDRIMLELHQGNNLFDIEMSSYQTGIYFIQLELKGLNTQSFKVIKLD